MAARFVEFAQPDGDAVFVATSSDQVVVMVEQRKNKVTLHLNTGARTVIDGGETAADVVAKLEED